jgi:hypothetical protein
VSARWALAAVLLTACDDRIPDDPSQIAACNASGGVWIKRYADHSVCVWRPQSVCPENNKADPERLTSI